VVHHVNQPHTTPSYPKTHYQYKSHESHQKYSYRDSATAQVRRYFFNFDPHLNLSLNLYFVSKKQTLEQPNTTTTTTAAPIMAMIFQCLFTEGLQQQTQNNDIVDEDQETRVIVPFSTPQNNYHNSPLLWMTDLGSNNDGSRSDSATNHGSSS